MSGSNEQILLSPKNRHTVVITLSVSIVSTTRKRVTTIAVAFFHKVLE